MAKDKIEQEMKVKPLNLVAGFFRQKKVDSKNHVKRLRLEFEKSK